MKKQIILYFLPSRPRAKIVDVTLEPDGGAKKASRVCSFVAVRKAFQLELGHEG